MVVEQMQTGMHSFNPSKLIYEMEILEKEDRLFY